MEPKPIRFTEDLLRELSPEEKKAAYAKARAAFTAADLAKYAEEEEWFSFADLLKELEELEQLDKPSEAEQG